MLKNIEELWFPTPLVVDSVFYIAGSVHSNTYEREFLDDGGVRTVYDHYPTVYGAIALVLNLRGDGLCDFCTTRNNRMFTAEGGLQQDREDWYAYSYHHDRFH